MRMAILFNLVVLCFAAATRGDIAGNALLFDGTDDYVHAPYIGDYQTPVFTMECWVYPTADLTVKGGSLMGRGEDLTNDRAWAAMGVRTLASPWGNGVGLLLEDNSDVDYVFSGDYFPPVNSWTHLAATRDAAGLLRLYVNGSLLEECVSTVVPASVCEQELTVAAYWNSGPPLLSGFFSGVIDEVRLWDVARSTEQMEYYYNRLVDPASAGLIGYWDFDDGTGVVATDLTGKSNALLGLDGTGIDVPQWVNSTAPIIPEPTTLLMLGLGAVLLRKRK